MIERLIFDCDGVLVDSEVIADQVLAEELAHRLPDDVDVGPMLHNTAGLTTEAILRRIGIETGVPLLGGTLDEIEQAVDRALAERVEALPDVDTVCRAIELPKAVVSNSSLKRVGISLHRVGLLPLFQNRIFTADWVSHPKPAPDVYLYAARSLRIGPRHCLVVEDSVAGVTAARAAGMSVIGFTGASHHPPDQAERLYQAGADTVIAALAELPKLVEDRIC